MKSHIRPPNAKILDCSSCAAGFHPARKDQKWLDHLNDFNLCPSILKRNINILRHIDLVLFLRYYNFNGQRPLQISFAKPAADFAPIVINGKAIEVVSTVKLLGLNSSSDLRWNCHVAEISKKVACRLYFLRQLKRANISAKDLLIFYLTCIRPVTEYACPVFHNALPAYLSAELEQLQKRAMRIIFPFVPYSDALHQANLETLSGRRQSITNKLFNSITCNSDHKLHELLPPRNNCEFNLRRKNNFPVPLAKKIRRRDLRTHLYIVIVIKFLATCTFLLYFISYFY